MSATVQGQPEGETRELPAPSPSHPAAAPLPQQTLGALPVGARLILRCPKEWRSASVAARDDGLGRVVLSVASPTGHTYRVRRPADTPLALDGSRPVLGEGAWRACFARYDLRW